jgi:hypothetical protein
MSILFLALVNGDLKPTAAQCISSAVFFRFVSNVHEFDFLNCIAEKHASVVLMIVHEICKKKQQEKHGFYPTMTMHYIEKPLSSIHSCGVLISKGG